MFHDTPTKPGALVAPLNLAAICTARDAALARIEEGAAALRAAYDLTQEAAQTAKGAHGGWHSPRTDRGEASARDRLFPGRFDPAESIEAFRRDLDAAIWTRLLEETGLRKIMDAKERDDLDAAMQGDVPPATMDNITATIERLTRHHAREDAFLAPALPPAVEGLVRAVGFGGVPPSQTIAIDEDNAA